MYWQNFPVPEDLSAYDGLELRLKGDGCRYKLIIRTSREWDTVGYTLSFDTLDGQWQSVSGNCRKTCYYESCFSFSLIHVPTQIQLPFSSLRPVFRARTASDAAPFDASQIISIQACNFIISYFSIGIIVIFFFLALVDRKSKYAAYV